MPPVADKRIREVVAARLVAAWSASGMSMDALVEESGLPRTTIYRSFTGERFPSSRTLMLLCPALGISADWVLGIGGSPRRLPLGATRPRVEGEVRAHE